MYMGNHVWEFMGNFLIFPLFYQHVSIIFIDVFNLSPTKNIETQCFSWSQGHSESSENKSFVQVFYHFDIVLHPSLLPLCQRVTIA